MDVIVGYILYNTRTAKFIGRDSNSGGYPWKSDSIQNITIWESQQQAGDYKSVPGFEDFGSADWEIYPLVMKDA